MLLADDRINGFSLWLKFFAPLIWCPIKNTLKWSFYLSYLYLQLVKEHTICWKFVILVCLSWCLIYVEEYKVSHSWKPGHEKSFHISWMHSSSSQQGRNIFWPPANAPTSGSLQLLTPWLYQFYYPAVSHLPSSMLLSLPNWPTPNYLPPLLQPDTIYYTLAIAPTISPKSFWWPKPIAQV